MASGDAVTDLARTSPTAEGDQLSTEQHHREHPGLPKNLGDGLVLRRARKEDAGAVAAFNERVHSSSGGPFERREPQPGIAACTRDLMGGDHPTCDAPDFTVVEDTRTGAIVSSACLIPQRFSYEDVEFGAGLPELVGTHPDHRGRGLVGEQFGVLHRWSEERGHLMQAIAGIPHYYRRFGYEMAVWMGAGRKVHTPDLPNKEKGDEEGGKARPYRLRPAEMSDAPALERRLADSVAAHHTGELRLSFYGDGLRLELRGGDLVSVEGWKPTVDEGGDAAFPGLTFLQLLFGHRSLEELDRAFADCSPGEGNARVVLKALFPERPSDLWPVC